MNSPITARNRARALSLLVSDRLAALQRAYLAGAMAAQSDLAKLRRALGRPAGSVPEVWELTIADFDGIERPTDGAPTRVERAAHLAMTLYALNQRSKNTPMHLTRPSTADLDDAGRAHVLAAYRNRAGLGRAAARLRSHSGFNEAAVVRRFAALSTAETFDEVTYHLRSMVGQFNGESIGLDFGLLAHDLYLLQHERHADDVRLSWARDFHRHIEPPTESPSGPGTADITETADTGAAEKAGTDA